jgi:hypothetical protein
MLGGAVFTGGSVGSVGRLWVVVLVVAVVAFSTGVLVVGVPVVPSAPVVDELVLAVDPVDARRPLT